MKRLSYLLLVFIILTSAACSNQTIDNQNGEKNKLAVVASFYPIAFLAEQIGGDMVEVRDLAQRNEVHDYEPTPQDIIALNNADLILFHSEYLEPWVPDVIPPLQKKGKKILAVTNGMSLYRMDEEEAGDEHHAKDEHEDEIFDPHVWLDPLLAQNLVEAIAIALVDIDPNHAREYQQNASFLKQKFQKLDQAYRQALNSCEHDTIIISHDAFGYLARHYNFQTKSIAGLSTDDEPSAGVLASLKEVAKSGSGYILSEENTVSRFAETLSRETGLDLLAAYTLEQTPLNAQEDVFDFMEKNLENLTLALACHSSQ